MALTHPGYDHVIALVAMREALHKKNKLTLSGKLMAQAMRLFVQEFDPEIIACSPQDQAKATAREAGLEDIEVVEELTSMPPEIRDYLPMAKAIAEANHVNITKGLFLLADTGDPLAEGAKRLIKNVVDRYMKAIVALIRRASAENKSRVMIVGHGGAIEPVFVLPNRTALNECEYVLSYWGVKGDQVDLLHVQVCCPVFKLDWPKQR